MVTPLSTGSAPRDLGALETAFDEYRLNIEEIEGRVQRLESEVHEQAEKSVHAPVIKALETFRGIKEIGATRDQAGKRSITHN